MKCPNLNSVILLLQVSHWRSSQYTVTHVRNKNSYIQGRSPNVVKVIFNTVLFVCFIALRPKSTAMVMAGRSVHLTTLFPGQA